MHRFFLFFEQENGHFLEFGQEVKAATQGGVVKSIEDSNRTQYTEIDLPADGNSVISVTSNTGNVLNYTVEGKKVKVSVGNGTIYRNDYIYSGLVTGKIYVYGTSSARVWRNYTFPDGTMASKENAFNCLSRSGGSMDGPWSDWYTPTPYDPYDEDESLNIFWGEWGYPGGGHYSEYKFYTSRTPALIYSYDIAVTYSTNYNPTISNSTQGNETFSASSHSSKEVA